MLLNYFFVKLNTILLPFKASEKVKIEFSVFVKMLNYQARGYIRIKLTF